MQLDPRIQHIFPQAKESEKFIATAILVIADELGISEKLFEALRRDGLNPMAIVAGHPLFLIKDKSEHFLRTRERFSDEQIKQLKEHLAAHGVKLPPDPPKPMRVVEPLPEAPVAPVDPVVTPETTVPVVDAPATEPTFAGHKLSELASLSDEELLKIDGIGRKTIEAIRKASASTSDPEPAA